jgi:hypothetical protein
MSVVVRVIVKPSGAGYEHFPTKLLILSIRSDDGSKKERYLCGFYGIWEDYSKRLFEADLQS